MQIIHSCCQSLTYLAHSHKYKLPDISLNELNSEPHIPRLTGFVNPNKPVIHINMINTIVYIVMNEGGKKRLINQNRLLTGRTLTC
ncbi:hypothetical protein Hanom_Chr15g01341471 [Helianthus anomalus]